MKYKYLPEHLPYMKEQIWECKNDLEVYSTLSDHEYSQIKDHIVKPKKIIDLGCGLGRGTIHLNSVLNDPNIHYIMADTTGDTVNTGGWNKNEYYNNLELTSSFAKLNGVSNFQTFDTIRDSWTELHDVDFVISLCSFGMHIPIENIMNNLLSVTTDDCTMIFGTRQRHLYNSNSFKDIFEEVLFLQQNYCHPYPLQDWLILKKKRKF